MYLFTELILSNSNYLNYCLSEKGTLKTALTCSMSSVICPKLLSLKVKNKQNQTKPQPQLLSSMSLVDSPAS